eukprot:TRINITY_DN11737_c0_g1_i1.p1 TRINITY_DN11737_c0_g1~~TRINITY_DN11737_c0_g1_i1.p1  ORF type:complete len:672 (-),score=85.82 TRINITY_DN11737_c0_g1_i1:253-2268(-)
MSQTQGPSPRSKCMTTPSGVRVGTNGNFGNEGSTTRPARSVSAPAAEPRGASAPAALPPERAASCKIGARRFGPAAVASDVGREKGSKDCRGVSHNLAQSATTDNCREPRLHREGGYNSGSGGGCRETKNPGNAVEPVEAAPGVPGGSAASLQASTVQPSPGGCGSTRERRSVASSSSSGSAVPAVSGGGVAHGGDRRDASSSSTALPKAKAFQPPPRSVGSATPVPTNAGTAAPASDTTRENTSVAAAGSAGSSGAPEATSNTSNSQTNLESSEARRAPPGTPSAVGVPWPPPVENFLNGLPLETELRHFQPPANLLPALDVGRFAFAPRWRKVGSGAPVKRARFPLDDGTQVPVAVKMFENTCLEAMRERCRSDYQAWFLGRARCEEDPLTEIGVYRFLADQQSDFVLRMLGAFRGESQTWLVLEYCESELFDVVNNRESLFSDDQLRRYTWQLLKAVEHLHTLNVGHRDISLENVLVRHGDLKLMDFGQAVLLRNHAGETLRYFQVSAKPMYRAPEAYIPPVPYLQVMCQVPDDQAEGRVVQMVPTGGYLSEVRFAAGVLPRQAPTEQLPTARAQICGYQAGPADMFACGVCLFVMHTRSPPWQTAQVMDKSFRFVYTHGVLTLLERWQKPMVSHAAELLRRLVSPSPAARPDAAACLGSPWFHAPGS